MGSHGVPFVPDAKFRAKVHPRLGQVEIEPETVSVAWDPLSALDKLDGSSLCDNSKEIHVEPIDFDNAPLDIAFPSPRYAALRREEKRQQRQKQEKGSQVYEIAELRKEIDELKRQQTELQRKLDEALEHQEQRQSQTGSSMQSRRRTSEPLLYRSTSSTRPFWETRRDSRWKQMKREVQLWRSFSLGKLTSMHG